MDFFTPSAVENHCYPTRNDNSAHHASLIPPNFPFRERFFYFIPAPNHYEFRLACLTIQTLQITLENYSGQISIHYPKHKLLHSNFNLIPKPLISDAPLDALTIFTDGSGKSHKSVIAWQDPIMHGWKSDIETAEGSPQIVKLVAVV